MREMVWGVDLGGSPWPCVRRHAGPSLNELRDEPDEILGSSLLRDSEPLLTPPASGDPGRPEFLGWPDLTAWLRRVREPIRAQLSERSRIGVAYPRTMPPVLRIVLPILFGADPATSKGGLPPESPLIGLDAPTALILEAIAREAIPTSGSFAVASGEGADREWTAATVKKSAPRTSSIKGAILRIRLGRSAATPDALGLRPGAARLVAGSDPVEDRFGATTVRLAPSAIAEGAARFALWLALEPQYQSSSGVAPGDASRRDPRADRKRQAALLPGVPVFSSETVHPLGLIGNNGRGFWFWRRLFTPGTSIPSPRAILRSATSPPCEFYLAECLNPDYRSALWLPQEDWAAARLRWHSHYVTTDTRQPSPTWTWTFELRDFNDRRRDPSVPREEPPPRWGLPTWLIRAEPDGLASIPSS